MIEKAEYYLYWLIFVAYLSVIGNPIETPYDI